MKTSHTLLGLLFLALSLIFVSGYSEFGAPVEFGNASTTTCWIGGDDGILKCIGNLSGNILIIGETTINGSIDASNIEINIPANCSDGYAVIGWENNLSTTYCVDYHNLIRILQAPYGINTPNITIGHITSVPVYQSTPTIINIDTEDSFVRNLTLQGHCTCSQDTSTDGKPIFDGLTITGNATFDTNTLFVDSTDDRVGIGTANPDKKLTIYGTGSATGSDAVIKVISFSSTYTNYLGQASMLFGKSHSNTQGTLTTTINGERLGSFNWVGINSNNEIAGGVSMVVDQQGNAVAGGWGIPASLRFLVSDGSAVDALYLEETGNVGIGTTTPSTKLEVNGDIDAESFLIDGTADRGILDTGAGNTQVGHNANTFFDIRATSMYFKRGGVWMLKFLSTDFSPYSDNVLNLGTITARWKDGYFAGRLSSGILTFSTLGPTDNLDVSGINTLFINAGSNDVTIGGFVGGVAGQVIYIGITDATNDVTLEHIEGTGNQDLYLHKGSDETLSGIYGGWTLACNGTNWYDVSHAKHVP